MTLAAWLRREPQVEVVARDRSTEYGRGAALGAPTAVQVADRWHLLLNTRQMVERWLARVHPRLKQLPPVVAPPTATRRTRAYAAAHTARVVQDGEAAKVVDLARRFCRIVRNRCGTGQTHADASETFDAWLDKARRCGVRVVESFASSLDADGAAVRAGLRLPWSSGQAEGQVNRLKLLKRSMYGRAKLDLLRRRFLLAG